jgi:pyruvate dehydrogenase E2 component (dihydrolipoamide acetyltransferase)
LGNLYKRKQVDIYIATLLRGSKGKDLSGFIVRNVSGKSIAEIASDCKTGVDDLRQNTDEENLKVQQIVDPLPTVLLRPLLLVQEFLQFTLNLSSSFLGMPKDRFGSAMITNIGALGIENAYIPLSPYSRCPLLVGIGKPRKIPVVSGDQVTAANSVVISFTFDHRYVDGAHGAHLMRRFKTVFADPSAYRSVFQSEASDANHSSDSAKPPL